MSEVTTDNFTIATYAKGNPDANKLAIVIPGRLDTKDYAHMTSHVDFLAGQGYYALSFDPPGTWGSPGDIGLYSTTSTLKAINELIEHFGNKPTLLLGHSRGGANAMLAGISNHFVTGFVAVMSHSGPTTVELPKDGKPVMSYRDLPPGTERTKERKEFSLPGVYFEDQEKYDATEGLKSCHKPKLFFYGTRDVLVSAESVKDLYELSSEPKMIHELITEHDYRLHPEIIEEVNQTILDFLRKYPQ